MARAQMQEKHLGEPQRCGDPCQRILSSGPMGRDSEFIEQKCGAERRDGNPEGSADLSILPFRKDRQVHRLTQPPNSQAYLSSTECFTATGCVLPRHMELFSNNMVLWAVKPQPI